MLLVVQVVAAVAIMVAAVLRIGDRYSYFRAAIAALLCGVAFLWNVSTPVQLVALSEAEFVSAERLNDLAQPIAAVFFPVALGSAIGACLFRERRPARRRAKTPAVVVIELRRERTSD